MFVVSLDGAIISTSLPQMAQSFGVTPVDVNVGIVAYLLSVAAFIPLSAWVTNRFGARTVFAAAIAVFALASVACGLATSLPVFIAARVGQGIGGALIMPLARVLVLQRAEKHEIMQATALTVWPAAANPPARHPRRGRAPPIRGRHTHPGRPCRRMSVTTHRIGPTTGHVATIARGDVVGRRGRVNRTEARSNRHGGDLN